MTNLNERKVTVNGHPCRVWEKGVGPPLGYLPGPIGLTRWTPFLDRLARERRVVVPSLPGFPGGLGHDELDDLSDWVSATLDLLEASGLDGADLVGVSLGGTLAAEAAAFSPHSVRRLVLVAPFGIYVDEDPFANFFAANPKQLPSLLSSEVTPAVEQLAKPDHVDEVEWSVITARALTSGARLLWPMGDTRLVRRLHRISAPTLVVWGEQDAVIGPGYAKRFAAGIGGLTDTFLVPDAGHHADWDRPDEVAERVLTFLGSDTPAG